MQTDDASYGYGDNLLHVSKVILTLEYCTYVSQLQGLFNWRQSASTTGPESRDGLGEAYLHVHRAERGVGKEKRNRGGEKNT